MEQELSDRQRRILSFIVEKQQEGWTPSMREIGQAVGLRSSAAVQKHLNALESKGYIRRLPGKARSIHVLRPVSKKREGLLVPIVGEISAGVPILAEENIQGYLTLVDEVVLNEGGTFFALRVKGESMIEAGILPGDYVVVRQQPTADNGDIIVALLEDEATVKRFFKEQDHVRLQSANLQTESIITKDVQILGKVVSVIRKM
ncbi:MAG: transcriptional repressor LexA [Anaerolineae bacterium]